MKPNLINLLWTIGIGNKGLTRYEALNNVSKDIQNHVDQWDKAGIEDREQLEILVEVFGSELSETLGFLDEIKKDFELSDLQKRENRFKAVDNNQYFKRRHREGE